MSKRVLSIVSLVLVCLMLVACSGGKAIRGTFEFVTSTAKTSVIPTEQSERRNPLK